MAARDTTIRLRDGRTLGFAAYGAAGGRPVLYLSGTMGSRLEAELFDAHATRLGLAVIGVDRPGHGLSSPQPGRTFAAFAEDLRELADALGLERFALMGLSGGGAHAAAAAAVLGARVSHLTLLSAAGPPDAPGVAEARPLALRATIGLARWTVVHLWLLAALLGVAVRARGGKFFAALRTGVPGDARALAQPEFRRILAASWAEGTRPGAIGVARDLRLQLRPWDVEVKDPGCPVELWFGALDSTTPPALAAFYERTYARAALRSFEDEGHLLLGNHAAEILAAIAARGATASAGAA